MATLQLYMPQVQAAGPQHPARYIQPFWTGPCDGPAGPATGAQCSPRVQSTVHPPTWQSYPGPQNKQAQDRKTDSCGVTIAQSGTSPHTKSAELREAAEVLSGPHVGMRILGEPTVSLRLSTEKPSTCQALGPHQALFWASQPQLRWDAGLKPTHGSCSPPLHDIPCTARKVLTASPSLNAEPSVTKPGENPVTGSVLSRCLPRPADLIFADHTGVLKPKISTEISGSECKSGRREKKEGRREGGRKPNHIS